jgi:hypothetical protein
MTPKEKAEELVSKMKLKMPPLIIPTISTGERQLNCDFNLKGNYNNAKQCALIAVDEIIQQWEVIDTYIADLGGQLNQSLKFWQDVKQEIQAL